MSLTFSASENPKSGVDEIIYNQFSYILFQGANDLFPPFFLQPLIVLEIKYEFITEAVLYMPPFHQTYLVASLFEKQMLCSTYTFEKLKNSDVFTRSSTKPLFKEKKTIKLGETKIF